MTPDTRTSAATTSPASTPNAPCGASHDTRVIFGPTVYFTVLRNDHAARAGTGAWDRLVRSRALMMVLVVWIRQSSGETAALMRCHWASFHSTYSI